MSAGGGLEGAGDGPVSAGGGSVSAGAASGDRPRGDGIPEDRGAAIAAAAKELRRARSVFVLTGAGVSAESGIPTFRDALDGMWAKLNPEDYASREGFRRQPHEVWTWYAARRADLSQARPNSAHLALAAIEARVPRFDLATQNIDGLHQMAGSRRVIELHGNISRVRCFDEDIIVDVPGAWEAEGPELPPRCPRCGAMLRPDVVWFGELLPDAALAATFRALRACDLFFSVGTSGLVEPAASFAFAALERGATVIEVNPEPTPLSAYAQHWLEGPAGLLLPALVAGAWGGS